ncbi:hypothetical protein [Ponticoccus alexandrii]|uniref:Uncharacterized protein n=1 Tax=Ponticoccus alexandrii TaxID=1943633 RepID=A0ABX7FHN4_9RHOB|nr:hypothetical protein [Ponticoccus alexandrii]QRF69144.1 hypothetical protein GQA70_22625 [Ponticoccus alexandrii]
MTAPQRDIQSILEDRIALIQAIAKANSEILRLNQIASGLMFLDQKNEDNGADQDQPSPERDANETAIDRCNAHIETLEEQLAALDLELKTATERQSE